MMKKIVVGALLGAGLLYGGDFAIFRLRHSPTGTVTVRRYLAIQEKANRVEYVFNGAQNQSCVQSLFPHLGSSPCWYLRRHTEQRVDI